MMLTASLLDRQNTELEASSKFIQANKEEFTDIRIL